MCQYILIEFHPLTAGLCSEQSRFNDENSRSDTHLDVFEQIDKIQRHTTRSKLSLRRRSPPQPDALRFAGKISEKLRARLYIECT